MSEGKKLNRRQFLGGAAAGKKLYWDGPDMKVTNSPEVNEYVRRNYRKGWIL